MASNVNSRNRRLVPPVHNDPSTWLYRGEVAKLLNSTREGVRLLDARGALHPIKNARGDWLYDPDEVAAWSVAHPKVAARLLDDGDLTAAAFDLFDAGASRREIVKKLRITCDRVDALYEQWKVDDLDAALAARRAAQERERDEREQRTRAQRRRRVLDALKGLQLPKKPEG